MNRVLLICVALFASACGTRGPLYLPPDATPAKPLPKAADHTKPTPVPTSTVTPK